MKKVLITGGAGFVGRRLVKRLLTRGDEVHCVDNLSPLGGGIHPKEGWLDLKPLDYESFHFYKEDCREYFKRELTDDFDECFHLAAVVGGRLVIENNPLAVADDLSIDAAYWQWAAKTKPRKTVCFSSSAAYPIEFQRAQGYVLLKEEMIDLTSRIGIPDMSYGWSKLTAEYLATLGWQRYGLRSVCYRPFSGYGEDQDPSYPVPSICRRALEDFGNRELSVWGSGNQMRDFIYIEDCIDGVLATMDSIDNADALNLSTGIFTSFKSLASVAANLCGYEPAVIGTSDKPEGVFARAGDTTKQREYGFEYRTSLEEGLRKVIEHLST